MIKATELGLQQIAWWPDWRGQVAVIIAAGPSAATVPIDKLQGHARAIAINESFQLAPWADVLYSCDKMWWDLHKGKKDWAGLRLSHDAQACREYDIHRTQVDSANSNALELEKPAHLGAGGNSGFQALNLAIQFGATRIMLIGIDCCADDISHKPHWHGRHKSPLSNPMLSNFNRWRTAIDGVAVAIRKLGIDVVNCSAASALTAYPKMTIEQALVRFA